MLEHGTYKMKQEGQLIVITAFDAFNKEGILEQAKEYIAIAETIKSEPWACICDISQWELFTPDTFEVIDEVNNWCNVNNLRFLGFICNTNMELAQQDLLKKTHSDLSNVEITFCKNLQEAYGWLNGVGFKYLGNNTE